MRPSKVYILHHNDDLSKKYASFAAYSCDRVKMPYELFEGFTAPMNPNDAWNSIGLKNHINRINRVDKAQLCSAGHAAIWKKIADEEDCAVILEHDGVMLHNIMHVDIPDDLLIVLGYKVTDPQNYDHVKAGAPKRIVGLRGHEGAHAYVLNHVTARKMLDEIEANGVWSAVDNMYFLTQRRTKVPIALMEPTPAIGWLRQSTIWRESSTKNYEFIKSFKENYKGVN